MSETNSVDCYDDSFNLDNDFDDTKLVKVRSPYSKMIDGRLTRSKRICAEVFPPASGRAWCSDTKRYFYYIVKPQSHFNVQTIIIAKPIKEKNDG